MTKMIIKIWMLIALLMMSTAAGAQNVINLKSHPHWECEYELDTKVSFSGANAVETGDMKGPELSYRVYEADLNPGGTLNIKTVSQCLTRGDHKAAKYKAEISLQFFKEDTSSPLGKRIDRRYPVRHEHARLHLADQCLHITRPIGIKQGMLRPRHQPRLFWLGLWTKRTIRSPARREKQKGIIADWRLEKHLGTRQQRSIVRISRMRDRIGI